MSRSTLLEPVDRKQKLNTHVDRALGIHPQLDSLAVLAANLHVDRQRKVPNMVGPGEWQPGLCYRHDGWTNNATGFGTSLDKTEATFFRPSGLLSDDACESLFTHDDMSKRGITTIPKEMLRKGYGIEIGGKPDKDTECTILDCEAELGINETFMRAMWWGGTFGDGAVIIGADDGRPSMLELIPERVRKIDWIDAYDRRYYAINSYYTSGPKFGKPETYALGNPGMVTTPIQVVHESRMIRFGGAPTTTHMRQMRGGYDASKLQDVFEVLRAFATGHKSVEVLLTDGPQGVFKIKNLASLIGSRNKSAFEQRLQTIDLFRSAMRSIVIDTDTEDFERQQVTFAGLAEILDRLALRQAAAWHMPLSKLMGQGATGMNATGEGDTRDWYDELETDQTTVLAQPLRRFYKILCATKEGPTAGAVPKSISFKFNPLWTLDPKEESERRQNVATTDKIYVDMGAATAEEVALSRFTERGYNAETIEIDRDLRQTLIDRDKADLEAEPTPELDKSLLPQVDPAAVSAAASVDEFRALLNLGPDPDPVVGAMKMAEYMAKQTAATQPGSHPTDPAQNKPNGFDPPDPSKPAPGVLDPNGNPRENTDKPGAQGSAGPASKAPAAK